MKKVIFLVVCIFGLFSLTSCGSTAPCGLAKNTKEIKQQKQNTEKEVLVVVENV